jgi:pimeloyl-ACP methyl ester carboxylesterase
MSGTTATTHHESPVFFQVDGEDLFGVLTRPVGDPLGVGVVVAWGGGYLGSTGRNRIWVRLCRELSARGFHCLRFDYRGVGDSTGVTERFALDRPFESDTLGAIDWMRSVGVDRFVLVGWCFGARSVLAVARQLPGLLGLGLVSIPLYWTPAKGIAHRASTVRLRRVVAAVLNPSLLRGLLDPRQRARLAKLLRAKWLGAKSRRDGGHSVTGPTPRVDGIVLEPLQDLAGSRTPILLLYGTEDPEFQDYEALKSGELARVLNGPQPVEVKILPGQIHDIGRLAAQDAAVEVIKEWICGLPLPSGAVEG